MEYFLRKALLKIKSLRIRRQVAGRSDSSRTVEHEGQLHLTY
jgi:hypothetical protein